MLASTCPSFPKSSMRMCRTWAEENLSSSFVRRRVWCPAVIQFLTWYVPDSLPPCLSKTGPLVEQEACFHTVGLGELCSSEIIYPLFFDCKVVQFGFSSLLELHHCMAFHLFGFLLTNSFRLSLCSNAWKRSSPLISTVLVSPPFEWNWRDHFQSYQSKGAASDKFQMTISLVLTQVRMKDERLYHFCSWQSHTEIFHSLYSTPLPQYIWSGLIQYQCDIHCEKHVPVHRYMVSSEHQTNYIICLWYFLISKISTLCNTVLIPVTTITLVLQKDFGLYHFLLLTMR